MPSAATRARSRVFDRIADEYDRNRPTYPEELIDRACRFAGLAPGDRVLELGCGSGQLTGSLLARGLRVTALEPGTNLLALARERLRGLGEADLVQARFEEADLPAGSFRAVFCASAFHWVDPDIGWRKAARVLASGGALALMQYVGLCEERSAGDQRALMAAMARTAPQAAARWPVYRDLEETLAGARERRANISEVWSWLGSHDLARADGSRCFAEAETAALPVLLEQSAEQLNALLRTASFHSHLAPAQALALEREWQVIEQRLGRPIRSSTAAVLVTARVL